MILSQSFKESITIGFFSVPMEILNTFKIDFVRQEDNKHK